MSFDGGVPNTKPNTKSGGGAGHDTPTNLGTTTGPAAHTAHTPPVDPRITWAIVMLITLVVITLLATI